jgi:hypothetical protein
MRPPYSHNLSLVITLIVGCCLTIVLTTASLKRESCIPYRNWGLARLDLDYKESRKTDQYGNKFRYRAKVKDAHDAQVGRWAWDVFLVKAP